MQIGEGLTGHTCCRYGTGWALLSSKLLRDCTVHTLFESIVGPLQLLSITLFPAYTTPTGTPLCRRIAEKAEYGTSNGPTTDSTGVRTEWIRRNSDGYGARLVHRVTCSSSILSEGFEARAFTRQHNCSDDGHFVDMNVNYAVGSTPHVSTAYDQISQVGLLSPSVLAYYTSNQNLEMAKDLEQGYVV